MIKPNEAIVLAGGLGKRLRDKVPDLPKPMAMIDGRPFLGYLFDYLVKYGIQHVVLSVGYKWEAIKDYFGDSYRSMKLSYALEKEPLGTGGGIREAFSLVEDKQAFVLNGDTFFEINLRDLSEFYFAHSPDLSITVKRMKDASRYGTVELDVCKVLSFREKKEGSSGYINGGVYLVNRGIFEKFDLGPKFSFEKELLEAHLADLKICAMRSSDYFIDIGIPSDYERAGRELPNLITS